jgi:hypothetical protein
MMSLIAGKQASACLLEPCLAAKGFDFAPDRGVQRLARRLARSASRAITFVAIAPAFSAFLDSIRTFAARSSPLSFRCVPLVCLVVLLVVFFVVRLAIAVLL